MQNTLNLSLTFFIKILLMGLTSCDNESNCCTTIDVAVQIHYQTLAGENLINSDDDFPESKIKIYYKNGEEFKYINRGNLTYPKMYKIYKDSSDNLLLGIFPSNYYEDNFSTTLIKLNETSVDTLVCEFDLTNGNEVCIAAWLNGAEMTNRFIEVKK